MRKLGYLLLSAIILLTACTSSKKLLEKGQYDKAIQKAAKKLRKDPNDSEELYVLKEAYKQANMFDKDQIDFLEKENRDENWLDIYFLYTSLENRQDIIRSLPTSVRSQFTLVDYDDEIIQSKKGAAEAQYEKGLNYLDRGDRLSARRAYDEFLGVTDIYPDYKDVKKLLREAEYKGTNFVLLKVENNSDKVLPEDFDSELRKISTGDINSQWVQYETYADSTVRYDYYVVINIKDIEMSPETVEKRSYTDSKEIQDGMKYVLDANGNVKKDSTGNDIKVPNMVTVSAEVQEAVQHKNARVAGSIDYIDLRSNQLIKTDNISANAVFEHYSSTFSGNEDALSKESRKKIGNRPIPFPTNEAMLMDAAALLKDRAKKIMYQNRDLLAH
ncbi:MAG: hypothetical protein PVH63_06270 [Balneolaceae bacterium]|jgi:tetratricopeptide (TPR) repeat protein